MEIRKIFCVECDAYVKAFLTSGEIVYPHRPDLADIPIWRCPKCRNYVGTHYKSKNRLKPLGVIVSFNVKKIRQQIHELVDPIWKSKIMTRKQVYGYLSTKLGYEYHTGDVRTIEEGKVIIKIVNQLRKGIEQDGFVI